jgi:hypothetical protein
MKKNNKKQTQSTSINLDIVDQRVLAVRNYMSLLRQKGMSKIQAEAYAEDNCYDAYLQHKLYEANNFKYDAHKYAGARV